MIKIRVGVVLLITFFSLVTKAQNIALAKQVYVSSLENGNQYPASAAVDGYGTGAQINNSGACIADNRCTRWSSAFADPQWIYIDLGSFYYINSVKLYWEAAHGKNFEIQVSGNATSWTTVQTITGNTAVVNTIAVNNVLARYVRMYGTARSGAYGYSLWEFEVYGTLSLLPIRLSDFLAATTKEGVALSWKASLSRTSIFEIERSSDAIHFSSIGKVEVGASAGNLTTSKFVDKQPVDGKNYYRLKYKEQGENNIEYSDVVMVNTSVNTSVSVYPNPVKGNSVQVNLAQPFSGSVQVQLLNTSGAVITSQTIQLSNSKQFQAAIKAGLTKGVYWLKIVRNQSAEQVKISIE